MNALKFYFLLACFLFVGAAVNAQTLNTIYSGAQLPTENGWQELKLDGTTNPDAGAVSQQVTGGVLKLQSTNEPNQYTQLGWYKTGLGLNLGIGYTIEIKAKVVNAAKYGAFNIQGYDNEGKGFRLGIYGNYVAEFVNPFAATNVLESNLNNSAEFHTWRLAVQPDGTATLYRDSETIGTFPLSAFYFDNIIENGGFEDGERFDDPGTFPDFLSDATIYRTSDPEEAMTGSYGLLLENDSRVGNGTRAKEKTRNIAIKQGTTYDVSFARKRTTPVETRGYRDVAAYYDTQIGTMNEGGDADNANSPNVIWTGSNDDWWQVHSQKIITPDNVKSLRFEFPSWADGDRRLQQTAFDDFYLSENLGLKTGLSIDNNPGLPAGYVNLIANGGFEDHHLNNDGAAYDWTLSNENNDNLPVGYNAVWGGDVRIQKNDKPDDELGGQWAHSGTSSLRFSSLESKDRNFNFTKELESGKTYRFNFWTRNPHWNDYGWVRVKIGNQIIWGHQLGGRNNVWSNVDLTFTTTADNKTLSLYSTGDDRGNWMNVFFDDLVLYEVTVPEADPTAGKTNLIANGDFENVALGNDNQPYTWALASTSLGDDDNYPVAWSDLWGSYVRLQDKQKQSDTGVLWAHSGTHAFRFSYLDDRGKAQEFEGKSGEGVENDPEAWKTNMDFNQELEPDKTYTFIFWLKIANYPDRGKFFIDNGEHKLWGGELTTEYINWTKQTITFKTTEENHTLRMFTEFTGWCNFYLDDLFLYEEDANVPPTGNSYLFFGKSTGTQAANVEIEYIKVDNTGAYAPEEVAIKDVNASPVKNLKVYASDGHLTFNTLHPAAVRVYNVAGVLAAQLNVQATGSIALPQGVYIVKSVSKGMTEVVKVINK
jgi:hypothetical protein